MRRCEQCGVRLGRPQRGARSQRVPLCQPCGVAARRARERASAAATRNRLEGGVGVLLGPRGERIAVDVDVFPLVSSYPWAPDSDGYARATVDGSRVFLHRIVTNGKWAVVDHINRNRCDNRRENLRDGAGAVNALNRTHARRLPRGVTRVRKLGRRARYIARITVHYRPHHIGSFDTPTEAAEAVRRYAQRVGRGAFYTEAEA